MEAGVRPRTAGFPRQLNIRRKLDGNKNGEENLLKRAFLISLFNRDNGETSLVSQRDLLPHLENDIRQNCEAVYHNEEFFFIHLFIYHQPGCSLQRSQF